MVRRRVLEIPELQRQDDSYDPFENREISQPLSDFKALANLVKSAVGTGLFAMPNAFASVGLFIGIFGTILMGLLITVSLQMLLMIHDRMCSLLRRTHLTYDQIVVASLVTSSQKPWLSARVATYLTDVILLACYVGIGAVYIVFISGTIQDCVDTKKTIDEGYYALMLLPFLFLMNMVKFLNNIAVVSILGNAFLFVAALVGVVYALKDGIGDAWVAIATDATLYPKFIGTAFFSMSSPGIVLAIQHDMKEPRKYTRKFGILNRGMAYITLLHVFVGAIGYLKWGDRTEGNFIRNHPDDPVKIVALLMQGLSIFFSYGLQCYLPINIIYLEYIVPALEDGDLKGNSFLWSVTVRLMVSLVTATLAALVPRVDLFIGLVGAVSISTLSTLLPVSLYILVNRNNYGKFKWRCILGTFLLITGIFITLCAIIVSLRLISDFVATRFYDMSHS